MNREQRRARRPKLDDASVSSIAAASCEVRGCTCQPDTTLLEVEPGIYRLQIAHDDGCPVIAR